METKQENIIQTDYAEVMQKSYIDYANSQTVGEGKPKGVAVQQNQGPTNPD